LEERGEGLVLQGPGLEDDLSADIAVGGFLDDVGRWSRGGSQSAAGQGERGAPASSGDERGAARRSRVQVLRGETPPGSREGAAREGVGGVSGAGGRGGRGRGRGGRRAPGPLWPRRGWGWGRRRCPPGMPNGGRAGPPPAAGARAGRPPSASGRRAPRG